MENSPALRQNENTPMESVPGIGIGGQVFCPYGFQKSPCLKNGCELWVELSYGKQKVGRCAHAWQAIVAVETRQSIDKLNANLEKANNAN